MLIALAYNVGYSATGVFNFAQGDLVTLGALAHLFADCHTKLVSFGGGCSDCACCRIGWPGATARYDRSVRNPWAVLLCLGDHNLGRLRSS